MSSDITFHTFRVDVSRRVFKTIENTAFVLCGGVGESEARGLERIKSVAQSLFIHETISGPSKRGKH